MRITKLVLAVLIVSAPAVVSADNVKFPKAAAVAVDAGVAEVGHSMGGGKGGPPMLTGEASIAPPDAGPAGGIITSPRIADPVEDPSGFFGEVKALWAKGWPIAVLTAMVGILLALQKRVAAFRVEGSRGAAVVAAGILIGSAVIARMLGEANTQELLAAVGMAVAMILSPHKPPSKDAGTSA